MDGAGVAVKATVDRLPDSDIHLRWSLDRPEKSGLYFNTSEERMSDPLRWLLIVVTQDEEWFGIRGGVLGPYWAGPFLVGDPE